MPTLEQNLDRWGRTHEWEALGDEWSHVWGGARAQWESSILPRISNFIPAKRVLEIAPGHGRWSSFLIDNADEYVGVDLTEKCVLACRERFEGAHQARFEVNDGRSLPMVGDGSVDFAFSFDSLVHVELDILSAYLRELARVLNRDGVAFIHHSNLGDFSSSHRSLALMLQKGTRHVRPLASLLSRARVIDWEHFRASTVTADALERAAAQVGLKTISQELINWGHKSQKMIDCISVFTRPGSRWDRPNVRVRNPYFMAEAFSANAISRAYMSLGGPAKA